MKLLAHNGASGRCRYNDRVGFPPRPCHRQEGGASSRLARELVERKGQIGMKNQKRSILMVMIFLLFFVGCTGVKPDVKSSTSSPPSPVSAPAVTPAIPQQSTICSSPRGKAFGASNCFGLSTTRHVTFTSDRRSGSCTSSATRLHPHDLQRLHSRWLKHQARPGQLQQHLPKGRVLCSSSTMPISMK